MSYPEPPPPDGSWNSYLVVLILGFLIGSFGGALSAFALHACAPEQNPWGSRD